jgi:uncharacterized protein YuzE
VAMKIRYDKEGDVLYVEFKDTSVTTKRLDQDIAVDYDAEGVIAGIEVLAASKRLFPRHRPPSVVLENIQAAR